MIRWRMAGFPRVSTEILYYNQDYIDAKISGTVAYDGIVDGPAIVWALDENDTVVAQQALPNGYGSFEIQVPKLTSYDFKVFIDATGNGNPTGMPHGNIISTGMHRLGDLIASMSTAI